MSDVITIETATMERREAMDTKPQDQYAGRLKFACCRQCGNADGMQRVHRETIARLDVYNIGRNRWYRGPDDDEYVFYPCDICNWGRNIPADFVLMSTDEVLDWRNVDDYSKLDWGEDPYEMEPDYAALAAESEPVSQITDSRESAGEG